MSIPYAFVYFFLVAVLFISMMWIYFTEKTKQKVIISFSVSMLSIVLIGLCSLVVKPKLEANARYKPDGKIDIVWNEADAEYYINYLGRPMKLRDACPDQFGDYIDKGRIQSKPYVNVYEKTYLPMWGMTISNSSEVHFVHGKDARIDQTIEME